MDAKPWYRHPWPWFLIALPSTAVLGSVATAVLAVRTSDVVVAADYYKRGLSINEEIERADRAAALGVQPSLDAAGLRAGDAVTLKLVARDPLPPEAVVRIAVARAGASDVDPTLVLARSWQSADGRQATFVGAWRDDIPDAKSGKIRELVVETSTWRVGTRAELNGNSLTVPAPETGR
jgi:hypothetical protein